MVFCKLIDFDLMDVINKPYPVDYNNNLPKCHTDAQGGKPRKILHDRYSVLLANMNRIEEDERKTVM